MTRVDAIAGALAYFDDGRFHADLARRVAFRTESQEARQDQATAYLEQEIGPSLAQLGFHWRRINNPEAPAAPFLIAEREEGADLPTVLTYGHGDVIRGQDKLWTKGRGPWELAVDGNHLYGRGTADNKGQHTINFAALAQVLKARGKLGFNVKVLLETGEETGSPGLRKIAELLRGELAADVFIASDGPRLQVDKPMLYLGSRGVLNFTLALKLREGGHHSGNWGGLLANPAIVLASAIASIVDGRGRIKIDGLRAPAMTNSVRHALADIKVDEGPEPGASIDPQWGEPAHSPAERVFGSNTFEVLAWGAGNVAAPVNAIPPSAVAHCQIRFVAGSRWQEFLPLIRAHLHANGFDMVTLELRDTPMQATRLSPDNPWAVWAARSVQTTTGLAPQVVPNTGGSLPNDIFSDVIGVPTVWIPHSYGGCSQHAPDEHMLGSVAREALSIMAGVFWDLGEPASGVPFKSATPASA
jgi:acetylornithine deacetylase/succinyl-diaminopimelate desuccinylase-like protein